MHLLLYAKVQSSLAQHGGTALANRRGGAAHAQQVVRTHLSGTLSAIAALSQGYTDLLLPLDLDHR